MKATFKAVAVLALMVVAACAAPPAAQSVDADRALCRQATEQAQRGDQAWSSTLGRMTSLIELQRCQDDINAFVFGSMNGNGGGRD